MCGLMERADTRVSPPESVSLSCTGTSVSEMVNHLSEVIATHPRLVLLLCVPPAHLEDYGTFLTSLKLYLQNIY